METLIGIIGEILLDVVQELWPPILGIVDGLLVLVFAFLTWLFFTTGQPVKGAFSLLAALVFLAVGILWLKSGAYKRRSPTASRRKRR
ncbi:MAG TPA: hypothetical protein H9724_03880 [Candidatus Gemmiger avistercoris]|uniref:Uncharacterized protein n=1 Tax=Candidatus Gemmiger avistercoris TaxID=2838606 RepID=A0A9D2FJV5_9FIRM|nr:hypothetical protein [uncultured Subdoligranulum sp.]HIZ61892.1 hypothetical protein [Candidatus Gemmiger avistercoris]